jgi:lipooligosaccharide transport system permease protein
MMRNLSISARWVRVWQRNFSVYRHTWKISFLPPLLEPLFYLAAFGIGLSSLVKSFSYRGQEIAYLPFIAPALLAITIMYNAFFETSYASFVRMYYQKTFDAMLATPLTLEEVITGEIAWAATKAVIAALLMQSVISLCGLVQYPEGLLLLPLAALGGLAFAATGMVFTSLVPNIETFNLPIFLFITPMFLFSGTFFPLQNLPAWAQWLAQIFPLTHLTILVRACALGSLDLTLLWSLFYLMAFFLVAYPLAMRGMRKRLIK